MIGCRHGPEQKPRFPDTLAENRLQEFARCPNEHAYPANRFSALMTETPDYCHEQNLIDQGFIHVCGADEAGRGPLAGPVVAAAVILDRTSIPEGLRDSKKLSAIRRKVLYDKVLASSHVAICSLSANTIDQLNIRTASLYAMKQAIQALTVHADHALIDGNAVPDDLPCQATALIKGDDRSLSIAAASIIAKVTRDQMMAKLDTLYPQYGFSRHKGYPTAEHRALVARIGPCRAHRRTFAPVRDALREHTKTSEIDRN